MEMVILFKWHTFARYYYYGIFAVHMIYYLLYAITVTLPNLPFIAMQVLMTIVTVLSCIFLVQEMRLVSSSHDIFSFSRFSLYSSLDWYIQ